jgi:biopolymer transport protein ExbD
LEARSGLVVTVRRNGEIYVDQTRLTYNEFQASFRALAQAQSRDGVYLRADQSVPYGEVVRVLAVMRGAGVGDVGLVAEPEEIR